MSSLFSFLWSSSAAPAASSTEASSVPTPIGDSTGDDFVLVSDESSSSVPAEETTTMVIEDPTSVQEDSAKPEPQMPPAHTVPAALVASRSCRLYASAVPRSRSLRPLPTVTQTASAISPSVSIVNNKRSFASVLKDSANNNTSNTSPSSSSSSPVISYAQDAESLNHEKLLNKLDSLDSFADRNATEPVVDETIEAMLDSINYNSPPLQSTQPLSRESRRLYEQATEWTLDAEEPHNKRSKRAPHPTTLAISKQEAMLKQAKLKGKSKSEARVEEKAMRQARGFKSGF